MGLDMYLRGRKRYWHYDNEMNNLTEDGYPIISTELDLGYWRKHPNLHGYIVKTFADGNDDCTPIDLSLDRLNMLISAVRNDLLVPTTGFFFGKSDNSEEQKARDLMLLVNARDWLARMPQSNELNYEVYYLASW